MDDVQESAPTDLYIIGLDFDRALLPCLTGTVDLRGVVKIGRSGNTEDRFRNIQACSPFPLKILHIEYRAGDFEPLIHRKLKYSRTHFEWFYLDGDPVEMVLQTLANVKLDQYSVLRDFQVRKPPRPRIPTSRLRHYGEQDQAEWKQILRRVDPGRQPDAVQRRKYQARLREEKLARLKAEQDQENPWFLPMTGNAGDG